MTDEAYVRSVWDDVEDYDNLGRFISLRSDSETVSNWSSWSSAAEFTRDKLTQIRLIEEEIAWLTDGMSVSGDDEPIGDRILERERAALTELKRGMK